MVGKLDVEQKWKDMFCSVINVEFSARLLNLSHKLITKLGIKTDHIGVLSDVLKLILILDSK